MAKPLHIMLAKVLDKLVRVSKAMHPTSWARARPFHYIKV
jgi:hypothetical protein